LSSIPATELSRGDIYFLLGTVDPSLLGRIDSISGDADFIESLMEHGVTKVFRRIMMLDENEITTSITPRFLFEILLRVTEIELRDRGYTVERSSTTKVPVFDSQNVVRFLQNREMVRYLANMLTSFSRIHSYTIPVRVRKGIWRRIRYNDMDIDSLLRYAGTIDEEARFRVYKRIADLCLFLLGMFPEHVTPVLNGSFATSGNSGMFGRVRRTAEEYAGEGKRFYKLAGEHKEVSATGLAGIFQQLHEQFDLAVKPLNYISENLIRFQKVTIFPPSS
jgi:hypothetical protein